ncbi:putative ABC-type ATPase [Gordonia amarae]|uniref:UDP-N-acetylglucosamine kinase n=2 Tax=Gordonia amarae TaxID=36821 RepID=G7GQ50_9ACTN|nr:zeta toxin family protein [Gordonia amarae]MCS3876772.1 putative ABC-type ATPase [Gordonia amarae]GAB05725.1 zeta toxin family protein [Gordonia amarae NBRC 15530]
MSTRDREQYLLSDADSRRIFDERIVPTEFAGVAGVDHPVVHFFGGQPGAGKSVVQASVMSAIIAAEDIGAEGIGAVAAIIGDDFRPHHPAFHRLLTIDDEAAAFYTDLDSGRWVEQAIAWAVRMRPHVILEGTFRRPELTVETARRFTAAGFAAHLHVQAVHHFISRTRIFGRYHDQLRSNGQGRYTLPAAHDASYGTLPASVAEIVRSGVFAGATAYSVTGQVVAEAADRDLSGIVDAVANAQQSTPSPEETGDLLGLLDRFEATFLRCDKTAIVADLRVLRSEMFDARA